MAAWISPMTWTVSMVPTAAQMNAEIRDHLVWLKAALDLITGSTAADSGAATILQVARGTVNDPVFNGLVTGDTSNRFTIYANGTLQWGDGTNARDVTLFRRAADSLATSDAFHVVNGSGIYTYGAGNTILRHYQVDGDTQPSFRILHLGTMTWGDGGASSVDTDLYRAGANQLKTSDQFIANDGITTKVVGGAVSDGSFTVTPGSGTIAIDVTNSRIYVKVGATWKSVVVA